MATAVVENIAADDAGTVADLVRELGDIPLERIRRRPAPGTATEADVVGALEAPRKRICELVDGVLVEKVLATKEGMLAMVIGYFLLTYLSTNKKGLVLGADSPTRLRLGLIRIPDVCFISWERVPGDELPDEAITSVIPDLAVEVLSPGNTKKEMERKLKDYFQAGVRLVWLVQPKTQTAEVYTSPTKKRKIGKDQALDGGDVLPGFSLPLPQLFDSIKRPLGA
jgi:Uma2 family endonuclease